MSCLKLKYFALHFAHIAFAQKKLLDNKNVEYEDIRIDLEPARQDEMIARAKRTSVPQIFIDDYHVGGCDDLFALEAEGTLDSRLGL